MSRVPEKRDEGGNLIGTVVSVFQPDEIADGHYVYHRDTVRQRFHTTVQGAIISLADILPGKAPIEDSDRPENLVDTLRYTKPAAMDAADLSKARLAESPWSDDYWAIYLGILGKRYADPSFPASQDWEDNYEYVRSRPFHEIVRSGDAAAIDRLSPSEKYDLLVGDPKGTLTGAMWAEGKSYHDANGSVEPWMGICHGWAPASYMLPRPRKVVTALAADGRTNLRFYPSDIKALASLLWANARTVTKFIGSRSNDKDPETDEVGRVTSSRVFDTNPGTWHMSVVNQIGAARRSLVMDATYDYEVWNQPVHGYEYYYWNPQSMQWAANLAGATVPRAQFTKDRFAKYRTRSFATVAGVAMRVRYVVETSPSHRESDAASNDAIRTVDYYYDLELDGEGTILGGEWYLNRHPDFLWTPPPGARARTPSDQFATGSFSPREAMPEAWRKAAWRAAANGMPLARIVEQLIQLANA